MNDVYCNPHNAIWEQIECVFYWYTSNISWNKEYIQIESMLYEYMNIWISLLQSVITVFACSFHFRPTSFSGIFRSFSFNFHHGQHLILVHFYFVPFEKVNRTGKSFYDLLFGKLLIFKCCFQSYHPYCSCVCIWLWQLILYYSCKSD